MVTRMSGLIILLVPVVALIVVDLLAARFGVDSRPEFDDPRQPVPGITA
jgi:hypothetical protein